MPLIHGKSQKAFQKNIKTEMEHGKPQGQALAIAYSIKRKAQHKKMAHGGEMLMEHEAKESPEYEKMEHAGKHEMHEEMHSPHLPAKEKHLEKVFHEEEMASGMEPHGKYHVKHNMPAEHEDSRKLGQHGADEIGPQHPRMAYGGKIKHYAYGGLGEYHGAHELHGVEEGHQGENLEKDIVGRVIKKRQHMYSKGGMVANKSHPEFANEMPAEYDYLAKYDDMADHHSAGNLHGSKLNQEPVHEDHDIVSRILRKRKHG